LDNRPFILKTDHKNLTYLNVTLTGKVLRWKLYLQIKTHPFTCASYNPFEVLHLDHIGPLRPDAKGNMFILVIIDEFSRWVELYPTAITTAVETASCIFQHFGRFGTPEVIYTDRGTALHNEVVEELLRITGDYR
jgi:hypothetical protein